MPTARRDGTALYYETDGDGEAVAFVNDVGYGAWLWGSQYDSIGGQRETLVWDLPGTGRSDTPPGPYDVDRLAADFEAVLAAAGVDRAHVVGAGLGGMVGLRYAREYDRARTLALFGTPPSGADVNTASLARLHPASDDPDRLRASLQDAFSQGFRRARPDLLDRICGWRVEEDADRPGIEAQTAAMTGFEAGPLYELSLPTLVCHGLSDPVVASERGKQLAEDLPQGTYEPVEGKNLCFFEHARAVTDRLLAHVDESDR